MASSTSAASAAIQNIKVGVRIRNVPTWHGRPGTSFRAGGGGAAPPSGTTTPRIGLSPISSNQMQSNLISTAATEAAAASSQSSSQTASSELNNTIVAVATNKDPQSGTHSTVAITSPDGRRAPKEFHFDHVFSPEDSQETVYEHMVRPLIDRCLEGYNGCIFAYGQTASGKTYTMQGPGNKGTSNRDNGIIYRVANQIVDYIKQVSRGGSGGGNGGRLSSANGERVEVSVMATYLEIYQEQLRDLLCEPESQGDLRIRIDPSSLGIHDLYVEGLTERQLVTQSDFHKIIQMGTKRRTVAETNMNEVSSRSHSVLSLTIEQYNLIPSAVGDGNDEELQEDVGAKKRSKIHLIDLAGSERADSTGATGARLKEGSAINQSLSSLGNVINALTTGASHIPYRDSKLTFLLSDSLGGNALTAVIACVAPVGSAYDESVSTLRFAERAKKVTNRARVNVDPVALRIMALEAEVARLRGLLANCRCGSATSDGGKTSTKYRMIVFWRKFVRSVGCCAGCGARSGDEWTMETTSTRTSVTDNTGAVAAVNSNAMMQTSKTKDASTGSKQKVVYGDDVSEDRTMVSTAIRLPPTPTMTTAASVSGSGGGRVVPMSVSASPPPGSAMSPQMQSRRR